MPFPESSGSGLVDDYPINGADNGSNSEQHPKPRSKSASTRRSSHAGNSSGNGSTANNGSASANSKNVSHVPCKFYRQGVCQAGDSCPFSHEDAAVSAAVCKYFQKDNCKFGSRCALAHITPDGRRVNPKKEKNSQNKQSAGSGQTSRVPSGSSESRPSLGQAPSQSKSAPQPTQPLPKLPQPASQPRLGGAFEGDSPSISSGLPTTYLQAASGGGASALPIASSQSGNVAGSFGSSSGSLAFASPPSASSGHISQLAALAPIGSPPGVAGGASAGTSVGQPVGQAINKLSSPLLASGVVVGANTSNSTHSSFSFAVRPGTSAGSTRASSFHSTLVESQLFPASSRPGSISRSTGSSVWADRPKNPLAYEGSAIVDDDEDDLIGEDEGEGFEEDLVPPSLSDLLTPQERERRNSRHSSSTRPEVPLPTSANASTTELWSTGNVRYARSSFSSTQNAGSQRVFEPIGTPERPVPQSTTPQKEEPSTDQ